MFTIQTPKFKKNLDVADDFATLVEFNDGLLQFEFVYTISKIDTIKSDAVKLNVLVYTRQFSLREDISKANEIDTSSEKSIQGYMGVSTTIKNKTKSRSNYVIASRSVDPRTSISNEFVQNEKIGVKTYTSKLKMKRAVELKKKNMSVIIPSGKVDDYEVDTTRSERSLFMQLATLNKTDVSSLTDSEKTSMTSRSSYDKFSQKKEKFKPARYSALRYSQASLVKSSNQTASVSQDANDDVIAYVAETVVEDRVSSHVNVLIDQEKLFVDKTWKGSLIVEFELYDSSGNVIEVVRKNLDVSKHIRSYNMPSKPPIVVASATGVNRERMNIRIRQVDDRASKVKLFRRNVTKSPGINDGYVFVGEHELKPGNQKIVPVPRPINGFSLYRAIPISKDNVLSSVYTNVVVHAKEQDMNIIHPALFALQTESGVRVDVVNIPDDVVSIRINRRDMTLHDKLFSIASHTISTAGVNNATWIDADPESDHVYEYNVTLVNRVGDHTTLGHAIVEMLDKKTSGFVEVEINDLQVNNPLVQDLRTSEQGDVRTPENREELNVSFNITSHVTDKDLDNLKFLLEKQDMIDLFTEEVKQQRDMLKDVLAFNVKRIDLTTGQVDDFGIVTENIFSEKTARKNKQIQPVMRGHKYRYVVLPLAMPPETLFDEFEKTETDAFTKREFSFKPSKFRHPLALKKGTITNSVTKKKFHAKDSLMFGQLGAIASSDLDLTRSVKIINDVSIRKFDRSTTLVQWSTFRGDNTIDSFLILSEINGEREIIGKVHGELDQVHKFYHRFGEDDYGSVRYVIIPILNDFSRGQEVVTNQIVLG